MIPHEDFHRLRLESFFPGVEIVQLENWEFLDRIWIGEAIGFSEWLRPTEQPDELGSLAIDFVELPEQNTMEILSVLDLPLSRGMLVDEIRKRLGEPVSEHHFVKDRVTYEFLRGGSEPYLISCTVLNEGGLTYVVISIPPTH